MAIALTSNCPGGNYPRAIVQGGIVLFPKSKQFEFDKTSCTNPDFRYQCWVEYIEKNMSNLPVLFKRCTATSLHFFKY